MCFCLCLSLSVGLSVLVSVSVFVCVHVRSISVSLSVCVAGCRPLRRISVSEKPDIQIARSEFSSPEPRATSPRNPTQLSDSIDLRPKKSKECPTPRSREDHRPWHGTLPLGRFQRGLVGYRVPKAQVSRKSRAQRKGVGAQDPELSLDKWYAVLGGN